MSTLMKVALVVYALASAGTGGLVAYAMAVDAWPLALGIVAVWMFGWNPTIALFYAQLELCREDTGGAEGAGQAAQTSVGRHRREGPVDQAVDQVVELAVVR